MWRQPSRRRNLGPTVDSSIPNRGSATCCRGSVRGLPAAVPRLLGRGITAEALCDCTVVHFCIPTIYKVLIILAGRAKFRLRVLNIYFCHPAVQPHWQAGHCWQPPPPPAEPRRAVPARKTTSKPYPILPSKPTFGFPLELIIAFTVQKSFTYDNRDQKDQSERQVAVSNCLWNLRRGSSSSSRCDHHAGSLAESIW